MISTFISYMFHDPEKGWKNGRMKIKQNLPVRRDFKYRLLQRKGENSRYFLT
jgi:hypothetical protein